MGPMRVAPFLLLCGGAACSSSAGGPAAWTPGTAALDSTFNFTSPHSWGSAAATRRATGDVDIVVTNLAGGADACLAATPGSDLASVFQVTLSLGPTLEPGTHPLGEGWRAGYRLADVVCATAASGSASQGTLEIDSVEPSIHGIADLTFPGGRVLATFQAPFCAAAAATDASSCVKWSACPAGHGADSSPPPEACLASP